MTILAADIGGTKTIIALFQNGRVIRKTTYPSRSYPSLDAILDDFLVSPDRRIEAACFAVAGPVLDECCRITNLPWRIERDKLRQQLRTPKVAVINDFAAVGHGIMRLKTKDVVRLNQVKTLPRGIKAVLGPGTGLGEGIIYPTGSGRYYLIPSEGGHTDFAPRNEREWQLKKWLLRKYGWAEWDTVVSGPGMADIYEFLSGRKKPPEEITAGYYHHRQCRTAVDMLVAAYAREAANLALKVLPFGGLYLVGNITRELLPLLQRPPFRTEFLRHHKLPAVLKNIPLLVVTNPEIGLLGAAVVAGQIAEKVVKDNRIVYNYNR